MLPHLFVVPECGLLLQLPLQDRESQTLACHQLGLELPVVTGEGGVAGQGLVQVQLRRGGGGMGLIAWSRNVLL